MLRPRFLSLCATITALKWHSVLSPIYKQDFDSDNFLHPAPYSHGGGFDFLLNSKENIDLLNKRFVVFEIDAIRDNKDLFPVVTIIIMEAFINKMRRLKGVRKLLICEEAWKALSTANMAEYMSYMFKTVRKYFGEAVVVTQEVDDIIYVADCQGNNHQQLRL